MRKFFILLVVLGGCIETALSQTITIDPKTEYQTISGYGGMNFPRWIDDLNQDQINKAFGNSPGQIGLSLLRVSVSSNPSQFALEVPTAKAARQLGAVVFATPWSPPAALKSNNSTTGGELLAQNYGAYADHLLNFVSYLNSNGIPIFSVSLQNEPDISVEYESCFWSPQQMIGFLKEQGNRFTSTKLMVAESFNYNRAKTDPILNDTSAVNFVGLVGGHIYGGGVSDYPLARNMGKEVWMTEHYTESKNSADLWPLALNVGTEITNCMKVNFSAYVWWYIRRFYGLIDENGNITKRGYVMSHFSKFIRPGARRIQATLSSAANLDATAYKTDSSLVIVVVNRNTAAVSVSFDLNESQYSKLSKFTTSAGKSLVNDGEVNLAGGVFSSVLDGSSITTFTSTACQGGKTGNKLPSANAGPDQTIELFNQFFYCAGRSGRGSR